MAYDTDIPIIPDENILSRRPWYLVGVVLVLLSLAFHQPLLVVAGLLVIVLGAVPELWYRFCLSGVRVQRTFSANRAEVGDEIALTLTVENRKLLPLPWLEVEDEVPEEGLAIRGGHLETSAKPLRMILVNSLALWAVQRVTRRYRVRCLARGAYTFGPLRLESGDPFGLLTREQTTESPVRLLVYPLVVPIEQLGLPARAPFGERSTPRRLIEDPLRTVGVRAYMPGDEPRRIHWKATARTGELQSRVYEPSAHHTLAIFVDARTYDNPVLGYDPALLELGICAAASIATWGIDHGFAVGLYANGTLTELGTLGSTSDQRDQRDADTPSPAPEFPQRRVLAEQQTRMRLPPSTSADQIVRAQEALARLIPYFAGPITDAFAREESRLPIGATVVYIGTSQALGIEGLERLRRMRARGHAVTVMLTGDDDLPASAGDIPHLRIGNAQTWERLYTDALAARGLDRRGRSLVQPDSQHGRQQDRGRGQEHDHEAQHPEGRPPALILEAVQ
jgi:uncharacterized protein (DUF58 family)